MWLYKHLEEDEIEALNLKKGPRWKQAMRESHLTVCQMCASRHHDSKHFIESILAALKHLQKDNVLGPHRSKMISSESDLPRGGLRPACPAGAEGDMSGLAGPNITMQPYPDSPLLRVRCKTLDLTSQTAKEVGSCRTSLRLL
jgi:hypothetical protein